MPGMSCCTSQLRSNALWQVAHFSNKEELLPACPPWRQPAQDFTCLPRSIPLWPLGTKRLYLPTKDYSSLEGWEEATHQGTAVLQLSQQTLTPRIGGFSFNPGGFIFKNIVFLTHIHVCNICMIWHNVLFHFRNVNKSIIKISIRQLLGKMLKWRRGKGRDDISRLKNKREKIKK